MLKKSKPKNPWALTQLKKAVTITEARKLIAADKSGNKLNLYHLTDLCESLIPYFRNQLSFPFDLSDDASAILYKIFQVEANQKWSNRLALKAVTFIFLDPETKQLDIAISLVKTLPRSLNLAWNPDKGVGDQVVDCQPPTPRILAPFSPKTPENGHFQPLTQQLDQHAKSDPESSMNLFKLDLSTISNNQNSASTPSKLATPIRYSPITKPRQLNRSRHSNRSANNSPGAKKHRQKRKARNSMILDGHLVQKPKRARVDLSNRPKVRARRSLRSFLQSLIQS